MTIGKSVSSICAPRFPHPSAFILPPFHRSLSNPPATPEENQHPDSHHNHDYPHSVISVPRMKLRHVLEVHSVNPSDKGQRQHDCGKDRQHLHDLVQAI